jgi:hypothetical protein
MINCEQAPFPRDVTDENWTLPTFEKARSAHRKPSVQKHYLETKHILKKTPYLATSFSFNGSMNQWKA